MVSCCGNYEIETQILQVTDVHRNSDPLKIMQQNLKVIKNHGHCQMQYWTLTRMSVHKVL